MIRGEVMGRHFWSDIGEYLPWIVACPRFRSGYPYCLKSASDISADTRGLIAGDESRLRTSSSFGILTSSFLFTSFILFFR